MSEDTLEEFGTKLNLNRDKCEVTSPTGKLVKKGVSGSDDSYKDWTQWALVGPSLYTGVGPTRQSLMAGIYKPCFDDGRVLFQKLDNKTDDLIDLPDGISKKVCDEINLFWTREKIFKEYGFLHRRGYLLYGPAGSGKTALVQLVCSKVINEGDLVFICENPNALSEGLIVLRKVEPERRIVCVFEDIDAILQRWEEHQILSLLDGENQIDKTLNLATTNYPERLDKRIVARPRRFDRVMKIDMPSSETRRLYMKTKLKINGEELNTWVEKTNGLSFASLAELVISVKCLGNDFETTLSVLKKMSTQSVTSDDYMKKTGFLREDDD